MRLIVLISLCLLVQGCFHRENCSRGYVISQLETEQETPPAEEPEPN